MVGICANINAIAVGDACNDSPFVVGVSSHERTCAVGDAYNVVLCISDVVELLVIVAERIDVTFSIGVEAELCSVASAAENENTSVIIVELGSNTVDGLRDSLSACIVAVGDAPSNTML